MEILGEPVFQVIGVVVTVLGAIFTVALFIFAERKDDFRSAIRNPLTIVLLLVMFVSACGFGVFFAQFLGTSPEPEVIEVTRVVTAVISDVEPQGADSLTVGSVQPNPDTIATPASTNTPRPTPTPSPVPPSPVPTQDTRLFWDDFETGINPNWGMRGEYALVNGEFVVADGGFFEGYVGDEGWADYEVTLDISNATAWSGNVFYVMIRMQDLDNYMLFDWYYNNGCYFRWHRVENGETFTIPSSGAKFKNCCGDCVDYNLRLTAQGGNYRVFLNGEQMSSIIDPTFTNGGIGFKGSDPDARLKLDAFEIRAMN